MKLLNLPFVAQRSILELMEVHEIFLLSLISKRTKRLMKCSNWPSTGTCFDFDLYLERVRYVLEGLSDDLNIVFWTIKLPKSGDETQILLMKIDGKEWECRISFDKETGVPILWFDKETSDPMLLHKHITDLFRAPDDVQIAVDLTDQSHFPNTNVLKNAILADMGPPNENLLEEFFEKNRVTNCAFIVHAVSAPLRNESKVLQVKNLMMINSITLSEKNIIQYEGENCVFVNSQLRTCNILSIVKHWIEGNNPNLESMIITVAKPLDVDKIYRELDTKPFDSNRKCTQFPYKAATREYTRRFFDELLNCSRGRDVIRKSDGMIATIHVLRNLVALFVWNQSTNEPFEDEVPKRRRIR